MKAIAAITNKGQVTIPVKLRNNLGIEKGENIIIKKVTSLDLPCLSSLQKELSEEWGSDADDAAFNEL